MNAFQLHDKMKLNLVGEEKVQFLTLADYVITLLREFCVQAIEEGGTPVEHVGSHIVGFFVGIQTVGIFVQDKAYARVVTAIENELIYAFGHGDTSREMLQWLESWESKFTHPGSNVVHLN